MIPVTILEVLPQEIVRVKNQQKDGYSALVVGSGKKVLEKKQKGNKVVYSYLKEFKIPSDVDPKQIEDFVAEFLKDLQQIKLSWLTKWKGFQWVVRRYGFAWWSETHWSKFHREIGSTWQRKPRRTAKWYPMPGRMWWVKMSLSNVKVLKVVEDGDKKYLIVKWSIPGAYGSVLEVRK